jgi:hypothetical protein
MRRRLQKVQLVTKTEMDILACLLGTRNGPLRTAPAPYRDVIGGRHHKTALALEQAGLGRVEQVSPFAFIFRTHAMIHADRFVTTPIK